MVKILLTNVNTTGRVNASKGGMHYITVVRNVDTNNNGTWEKEAQFIDVQLPADVFETLQNITAKNEGDSRYKTCLDVEADDIKVSKNEDGSLKILMRASSISPVPRSNNNRVSVNMTKAGIVKDLKDGDNGEIYATIAFDSFLSGGSAYSNVTFKGEAAQAVRNRKLKCGSQIMLLGVLSFNIFLNKNGYPTMHMNVTSKESVDFAPLRRKNEDSNADENNATPDETNQSAPAPAETSPAPAETSKPEESAPAPADTGEVDMGIPSTSFMDIAANMQKSQEMF